MVCMLLLLLLILKNIPDFNGALINTDHTLMVALDVIVSEAHLTFHKGPQVFF